MSRVTCCAVIAACVLCLCSAPVRAQRPAATRNARVAAPIDITGYWVSAVTEDWRHRMVPPRKGDYESVPLNSEAIRIANSWDPAQVEAAGEQCKAYGAAAIMRVPGRLHIFWESDGVLRIDFDAGTQTRRFNFDQSRSVTTEPSWQGYSVAQWEIPQSTNTRGPAVGPGGAPGAALKAITTNLRPGFLRKNGIPYSKDAVVTEWFDLINAPNGDQWLIVKTVVDDPQYLTTPFITSTHFRRQPDAAGWNPTLCEAD